MVMIGTDSHKRTHTVVAVDDVGRRLDVKTVRTNSVWPPGAGPLGRPVRRGHLRFGGLPASDPAPGGRPC
jgi:hypothetical protein